MPEPTCVSCNNANGVLWRIGANGQICKDCSHLPKFFEHLHAPAAGEYSESVLYQNVHMRRGAIVSMEDGRGQIHFAQIRGFLTRYQDEVSAFVTWLVPTSDSPPPEQGFHASTYVFGSEDDTPCKLEFMKYIMQLPTDYYKNNEYAHAAAEDDDGDLFYEEFVSALRNAGEGFF
ncbi:PREDICTED: GATA zinc finger domain-containing protein 1-like [Papilio xuthus]|uniref:GATA zinc finger domain-containing protein 1 n=1 Tax=Papilio xuthus TaxID=66420 RepID=A0A194PEY9_PAPXU|nr:PREDICTED: GATA zinc finger domain-containing protein 1-like [Papilio xuthus]KPI91931.1 GATA zinc finger domain-containing protein 1 [Papilio xuthus]